MLAALLHQGEHYKLSMMCKVEQTVILGKLLKGLDTVQIQ